MGKQSEEYRLQMLRRLENRYGNDKPTEVLEAEEVIAKFRQEKARDRQAITRLSSPLPEPNLCPSCWFIHGRKIHLTHAPHPNSAKFDRQICPQCNYIEDTAAKGI